MEGPTGVFLGRTEMKLSLGSGAATSTWEALGWVREGTGPRRRNPSFYAATDVPRSPVWGMDRGGGPAG